MLFDVITTLILFYGFSVLPRLISRRRGDVLYYVSKPAPLWRSALPQHPVAALADGPRRRALTASMRYLRRAAPQNAHHRSNASTAAPRVVVGPRGEGPISSGFLPVLVGAIMGHDEARKPENNVRGDARRRRARPADLLLRFPVQPLDRDQRRPVAG